MNIQFLLRRMDILIEVSHLVKKYGKHVAVNDISFTVKEGEILGFLGPNGAGKSTTMNMMTGYLSSTSGTIKIGGVDILENPIEAKKNIGYLPEIPPLYLDMTVREYLVFVAKLKGMKKADIPAHIDEILEKIEITHVQKRLIKNLSKGYKQRVGLASALVGNPKLLILDEPTVGLDPKQIIEIRNLIKDLSTKHTIILSSHILSEISAICDKIMIINHGNMVAIDSPKNLEHLFSHNIRTVLRLRSIDDAFISKIKEIEGVNNVHTLETVEEGTVELAVEANQNLDIREQLFKLCYETGHILLMMQSEHISLEDIFLKATTAEETNTSSDGKTDTHQKVQVDLKNMTASVADQPVEVETEATATTNELKEGATNEDHTH